MIYTNILQNYSIVSDFSEVEGDFQQVLLGVLKANRRQNEFYYISYLNYDFYFLHKDEYTFSCIANSNVGNNIFKPSQRSRKGFALFKYFETILL
jgi:hypothetical protein